MEPDDKPRPGMDPEISTSIIVTSAGHARPYLTWLRDEDRTNVQLIDTDPLTTIENTSAVVIVDERVIDRRGARFFAQIKRRCKRSRIIFVSSQQYAGGTKTAELTDAWLPRSIERGDFLTLVERYRIQLSYESWVEYYYELMKRTFDDSGEDAELLDELEVVRGKIDFIQRRFRPSDYIAAFRAFDVHPTEYDTHTDVRRPPSDSA